MHIGIDLGTTFCCVAFIDDNGVAKVIPNSDGEMTTPSIIWFDGKNAYVGKKAGELKSIPPFTRPPNFEFIKREMGKPVSIPSDLYSEGDPHAPIPAPYEIRGFRYGADGMSAIILRKLKKDAIRYLKKIKKIEESLEERDVQLDAIITVPAYFGDKERQMTWAAGYAAGLNVAGIINEPTAAALTYGFTIRENRQIMVFDLGGGTFDVTILKTGNICDVITSGGARDLGGIDWDEMIEQYIYSEFYRRTNRELPTEKSFEIQRKALQAKFDLSENEETIVTISTDERDIDIVLYRSTPEYEGVKRFARSDNKFYFEERSKDLLSLCRAISEKTLKQAGEKFERELTWGEIDEILLAGGSCRMPMIPKMLEELTGKKIKRRIEGFSYDTAIAIGAALYGQQKGRVKDVLSHSIGVKYVHDERHLIDHLIKKDTHLPVRAERRYIGGPNVVLEVYEGESVHPDECIRRGKIPLNDIDGHVTVIMELDEHNVLKVIADYPPHRAEKKFEGEEIDDKRLKELREKVQSIVINV